MRFRFILPTLLCTLLPSLTEAQPEWREWNEATLAEAKASERPIYLVVGDPLSELSSSMRRDTFANSETAAFLDKNFVCVYADRDALPGIAAYGQQWLAAEQKIPGWPLNLWFTPGLEPIEAASYLPPTEEWGREGFMVVANRVADHWAAGAEAVARAAQRRQELIADYLPFAAEPVDDMVTALTAAAEDWLALIGGEHGVFGEPPHRPEPELVRFLIGQGGHARAAALAALRQRMATALRDPIDGGFYRGTVDNHSSIPVFQKRLTDQARIALACLDAAAVSEDPAFAAGARSALDYAITQLGQADGTYWMGDDATAPDDARRQTWTESALIAVVGKSNAASLGATATGNVDPDEDFEGSFTGRNILHRELAVGDKDEMSDARQKLLTTRLGSGDTRVKTIANVGAHGLMIHALRRAAEVLDDSSYTEQADLTTEALKTRFGMGSNQFSRSAYGVVPVTPTDHLLVVLGLGHPELAEEVDAHYYDPDFGLYYASKADVFGLQPLMWPTSPGELPSPGVWRLLIGSPPDLLAAEVAAPFDNPDAPPPGDMLLALQKHYQTP